MRLRSIIITAVLGVAGSVGGEAGTPRRARRGPVRAWVVLVTLGIATGALIYEGRTSALQAWLFSRWAGQATFSVQPGPGGEVVYPSAGPFNQRLGYTRIGELRSRLEREGFRTVEQARFSPALSRLARWGISPPVREATDAGLVLRDARGETIFDQARRRPRFERYEDIPVVVVRVLLHLEDRQLDDLSDARRNPAVNWGRFVGAGARYVGHKMGLPLSMAGGSTLATQMEKFRHSPEGRTETPFDKLKQMMAASLRVYRQGPDASEERRQIVLDYLNTVPYAAVPGYGEVNGLPEGLRLYCGVGLDQARLLLETPGVSDEQARLFKQVVAMLYAVRAPASYLGRNRDELARRTDAYLRLLRADGVVDDELVERALAAPLVFPPVRPPEPAPPLAEGKAVAYARLRLAGLLGASDLYALNRLHVDARTTLDGELQRSVVQLFNELSDPAFVRAKGLTERRMLDRGDPAGVVYSLQLFEATERGNVERVHADSLAGAFDINTGMKMELGSTAKLRTLVHYLDVVAALHAELQPPGPAGPLPDDPLTRFVAETLRAEPAIPLEDLLERALDRHYSASPREAFFTGGGKHTFHNFDPDDNGAVLSVREATLRSTNLVFVRLMRDLVRYYEARLDYDPRRVLSQPDDPDRAALLQSIADAESRQALRASWLRMRDKTPSELPPALLGRNSGSARHQAIVYFAWHDDGDETGLAAWLAAQGIPAGPEQVGRLLRAYGTRRLSVPDYGFLLSLHPLEVWCAGRLAAQPGLGWDALLAQADDARRESSAWLFKTRNRRAQDSRLRMRIERDAFARIGARWRELGFPFEALVPSLASAIGSSADRPAALAELMGLIVNDGVRRPTLLIDEVRLAPGTPYHAALEAAPPAGELVLRPEVARAVRATLSGVVERGTARRLRGAFVAPDGTSFAAGGKTGSGDNRREQVSRSGERISGEATSRTAAFVFFVGERHFGVITASVQGAQAAGYDFTSSLPLGVLRLLAPQIAERAEASAG